MWKMQNTKEQMTNVRNETKPWKEMFSKQMKELNEALTLWITDHPIHYQIC